MSAAEKIIDILLVEDSETDAELTLLALKQGRLQNTVHHVKDGEEAMRYLRRQDEYVDALRPDLILLDLNMPKLDGPRSAPTNSSRRILEGYSSRRAHHV